jgi:death on curing protein
MTKFLTVPQVIELHDAFLEDWGGLPGIRDIGLLDSAVQSPRVTMFGKPLHRTVYDQAAAYVFHIVQNHPFNDGNKRTGAICAILFLEMNNIEIAFSEVQYEELVVEVAQGQHTKDQISHFLSGGTFRGHVPIVPRKN